MTSICKGFYGAGEGHGKFAGENDWRTLIEGLNVGEGNARWKGSRGQRKQAERWRAEESG